MSVGYTGAFAFALEDATLLRTDIAIYSVLALAGVLAVFLAGYQNIRDIFGGYRDAYMKKFGKVPSLDRLNIKYRAIQLVKVADLLAQRQRIAVGNRCADMREEVCADDAIFIVYIGAGMRRLSQQLERAA